MVLLCFQGGKLLKKVFYLLMIMILATVSLSSNVWAAAAPEKAPEKMKAVWMATVFNIDFPTTKNDAAAQKAEYIEKIDKLKALGINTVVIQVRPKADALYKSAINPWSDVLTGVQGKDPGYDPLAFMIEEAHKRSMALHAWLNPYRVTCSGTDLSILSPNHPARRHPEWLLNWNNSLYYYPELEAVKKHITDTVAEIVNNYDVDAIHFDDYFYPANYPLPAGEGKDGPLANSRRQHVNDLIRRVSDTIKLIDSDVLFGISPMGIWKNSTSDPTGSETTGNESYYTVFADTRTWIKNGWIDYLVPQVYWEIGNKAADYQTLVQWWANEVKGTNVALYIGHGLYKDAVAKEIDRQLRIAKENSLVSGSFYYGLQNLLANKAGCAGKIMAYNGAAPLEPDNITPVKTGIVTAGVLNVRSGSGLHYAVLTKVSRGTKVTVLNKVPSWYNVKLTNGQVGWVSADYLTVQ